MNFVVIPPQMQPMIQHLGIVDLTAGEPLPQGSIKVAMTPEQQARLIAFMQSAGSGVANVDVGNPPCGHSWRDVQCVDGFCYKHCSRCDVTRQLFHAEA